MGNPAARVVLAVLFFAACAWSGLADTSSKATSFEHETSYFEVTGKTEAELGRSLYDESRVGPVGERAFGITYWELVWQYQVWKRNKDCTLVHVVTSLNTTVELPRWRDVKEAPPELQAWWAVFIRTLQEHEAYHVENARRAEAEVAATLKGLPPKSTCVGARIAADRVANQIVRDYRARDREYDRGTSEQFERALAELK